MLASCTSILGIGDFAVQPVRDAAPGDVAVEATALDAGAPVESSTIDAPDARYAAADATTCDVDLAVQCFPCAPKAPPELLNACTSASCVPFDDSTRLTNLLPDGGLPPLPPFDAGGD